MKPRVRIETQQAFDLAALVDKLRADLAQEKCEYDAAVLEGDRQRERAKKAERERDAHAAEVTRRSRRSGRRSGAKVGGGE